MRTSIITLLEGLVQRVYAEEMGDDRNTIVKNLVYILQAIQKNHWQTEKVLDFCLTLDIRKLWPEPEHIPDDCDIILKTLNTPESELYILIIEYACAYKESSGLLGNSISFLERQLKEDSSIWLRLSLSFEIHNLYYLDAKWTSEHIENIVTGIPAYACCCITTICSRTDYIYPHFSEILFSNTYLSDVLAELNLSKCNQSQSLSRIINYAVAAFYFDQIDERSYLNFLDLLIPKNFSDLFRSIVSEKNGDKKHTLEEVFYISYAQLSKQKSGEELSRAVIINASKIGEATEIIWKMIDDCINNSPVHLLSWIYISRIFERLTAVYFSTMKDVALSAIKQCSQPSRENFGIIRDCFIKHGQTEAIIEIANAMLDMGYYPEEMTEYIKGQKSTEEMPLEDKSSEEIPSVMNSER